MCEPMKPAPPITRTRESSIAGMAEGYSNGLRGHRCGHAVVDTRLGGAVQQVAVDLVHAPSTRLRRVELERETAAALAQLLALGAVPDQVLEDRFDGLGGGADDGKLVDVVRNLLAHPHQPLRAE